MKYHKALVLGWLAVVGCSVPDRGNSLESDGTVVLGADLVVASRDSTLALANGQTLDVSVTVKNRGAAASLPAAGRWELTGPGLDAAEAVSLPPLEAGEAVRYSFHYPFAATQTGQFVLTFTADPDGESAEGRIDNNRITVWVAVAESDVLPPPLASLAVTADVSALTFDKNAYITAQVTITNLGDDAVPVEGTWLLQGPGAYVSMPVTVPVLNAHESTVVVFQQVPDDARRGVFSLTFTANVGGPFVELDTADNTADFQVTVTPYPNLTAEILSATPLVAPAASVVALEVRWRNTGLSPLLFPEGISQPAHLHLVKNGEALDWKNYIRSVSVPVLGPGETTTATYQVPALRGAGAYSWRVTVETTSYEAAKADDGAVLNGATLTSPLSVVWVGAVPGPSIAAPTTVSVNGDGTWDLLVGRVSNIAADPDLYALDGNDGSVVWSAQVTGVALAQHATTESTAIVYTPSSERITAVDASGDWLWQLAVGPAFTSFVAADIDRDGDAELMVAKREGLAQLQVTDGSVTRQWALPETWNSYASPPALADFTHDGFPDVVMASLEGRIFAFANTGAAGPVFAWEVTADSAIVGGPLIADLDGDGELEIAVADLTGNLRVLAASTGAYLWSVTLPVDRLWMVPTLMHRSGGANLALVLSGSRFLPDGGWSSSLMAYDAVNGALLWRVDAQGTPGPVLAIDVDHDGNDEFLWLVGDRSPAVYPLDMQALQGAHGRLLVVGNDGAILTAAEVPGAIWSPPIAGDLDLDGWLDIVVLGAGPEGAIMRLATQWTWPAGSGWVGAPGSSLKPGFTSWP